MTATVRPFVARITVAAIACAFACGATVTTARGPAAAATTMVLPDCVGKPTVRPNEVFFACGDGGVVATHLAWTGWGATFAAARGTMDVNQCEPSCAAGKYTHTPVVLVADGLQRCAGRPAYRRVTYAFSGKSPFSGGVSPSMTFTCAGAR